MLDAANPETFSHPTNLTPMKTTTLLTTALAAATILFTSCDKKEGGTSGSGGSSSSSTSGAAVSEKDALARFKTDMLALKAETDSMKPDPTNPMAMLTPLKNMLSKLASVRSDGLPEDLKSALIDAQAKVTAAKAVFNDVPDVSDMKALTEKLTADPALAAKLQKMQEEVPKVMNEVGPAMEKVGEAAKKHGVNIE
jgi:hypothetical protein